MKPGDRVAISDRFPPIKARVCGLMTGDKGTIRTIIGGIAILDMDKGFRANSNVIDLDPA